mmetsp:Transcript_28911/g.83846  ORF Transcript_28911/g.83846 Transcript_28911/m.83846 type:complete len:238 (-) Transcript_28911:120-833(-)
MRRRHPREPQTLPKNAIRQKDRPTNPAGARRLMCPAPRPRHAIPGRGLPPSQRWSSTDRHGQVPAKQSFRRSSAFRSWTCSSPTAEDSIFQFRRAPGVAGAFAQPPANYVALAAATATGALLVGPAAAVAHSAVAHSPDDDDALAVAPVAAAAAVAATAAAGAAGDGGGAAAAVVAAAAAPGSAAPDRGCEPRGLSPGAVSHPPPPPSLASPGEQRFRHSASNRSYGGLPTKLEQGG